MDPELKKWLDDRGLEESTIEKVGAEYSSGVLRWPRRSSDGSQILGWKCRDLLSGRFFGDPSGIAHNETAPLIACQAFPSNSGAMICEGESDFMRVAQSSLPATYCCDVICIPGASSFPAEWVPILRRYDSIHVFADADVAGQALPNRIGQLIPGVRVVRLPEGEDVCSFLLQHSEEDLRRLYEIAPLHISPMGSGIRKTSWTWDDSASAEHRDKLTRVILADGVLLRPRGNEMVGLCPFHEERTPSFSVNPKKGLYRCFGCDAKGDVISYLTTKNDMSFGEAMSFLRGFN
jgi:DNA primase